jgi:c-di-GMP-binding flagellar brake protein YcgR
MSLSRRYHRIDLSSKATVHYRDNCYEGILGAISLGGAAINFNGSAMIPEKDECVISVALDETQPSLKLNARITNSSVCRVGVTFINMDEITKNILYRSLKKLSQEPETLGKEFNLLIAVS